MFSLRNGSITGAGNLRDRSRIYEVLWEMKIVLPKPLSLLIFAALFFVPYFFSGDRIHRTSTAFGVMMQMYRSI